MKRITGTLGMQLKQALQPLCERPGYFSCRDQRMFLHDFSRLQLPDRFASRTDGPGQDHDLIIQRLIEYFHRIKSEARSLDKRDGGDDMWGKITKQHAAFEAALDARDAAQVSEILLNVCRTPLIYGFEASSTTEFNRNLSLNVVDKLLALAEALGCMPVQCPEQGEWGYESIDIDNLRLLLQSRIPFSIAPPQAGGGAYGIRFDDGVLSERNLQAIHTTVQALDVLKDAPRRVVCEIGGGIGSLTLFLARAGMEEVCLYDIPTVSVIQAWFLLQNLGVDAICLHGETSGSARVRVLPFWQLDHAPDEHFTLVINQDSLPEIDVNIARHYLQLITQKSNGHFLHINQEGRCWNTDNSKQNVVPFLIEEVGGFQRLRRSRDWMREGYVSETYKIVKAPAA